MSEAAARPGAGFCVGWGRAWPERPGPQGQERET